MNQVVRAFAPAKINLLLHVGPADVAGYHPLCSLVTFADVGDVVTARPGPHLDFTIGGAFSAGLEDETDNLVTRARDAVLAARGDPEIGLALHLEKNLPVASGIGGGSSDAAAALRLVDHVLQEAGHAATDLEPLAAALGSDVPVCLAREPRLMRGRGEQLSDPPRFAALPAVLVNPGFATLTGPVFRAYDAGAPATADTPDFPSLTCPREAATFLATCRNDLEGPAIGLHPLVGELLRILRAHPETLLARMSGSGATCFALCETEREAHALAARLEAEYRWWIRPCVLQGWPG